MTPTVADILADHVTLSVSCVDRLYVNGYIPTLQTPGQLCFFLGEHLGNPLPSPALLRPLHERFLREVKAFVSHHGVPLITFQRGQRKDDIAAGQRRQFDRAEGVVFVGVAQERCRSFKGRKVRSPRGGVSFDFSRQSAFVNHYYFYVQDPDWGPGFLKIGSYAPYPVKLCLNGHEWVKQRLRLENVPFESLDNGFLHCEDPRRLQQICNELGPEDVQGFFDRWSRRLPWPLRSEDRQAGFCHRLSIWQIEVSLTQVFDRPLRGRQLFESLIRENLDLGRPDRVRLLFPQRITRATPPPRFGYRTRILTSGVSPALQINYKHSQVKQYFKLERALRTETTINDPKDFYLKKGIENLPQMRDVAEKSNRSLLESERLSQDCLLGPEDFDKLQRPQLVDGQRVSALRFGDPRVMALCAALCNFRLRPHGFRHRDLRPLVAELLGKELDDYTPGQMTYDLRRLRRKGVIQRIPHSHRYLLTPFGLRVAHLFSKINARILQPAWNLLSSAASAVPRKIRTALSRLDRALDSIYETAKLRPIRPAPENLTQMGGTG